MNTTSNNFLNITDLENDVAQDIVNDKTELVNFARSELDERLETAQRMKEIHHNEIWSEQDKAFWDSLNVAPVEFSVARPLTNKIINRQRQNKFKYRLVPFDAQAYVRHKNGREKFIEENLAEFGYDREEAGEFYEQYADDEYARMVSGVSYKLRQMCDGKYKESECFEGGILTGVDFLKANKDVNGKPIIDRRSFQKMFWDPNATEYDLSDAEFMGEVEHVDLNDLVSYFPEHKEALEDHFEYYANLKNNYSRFTTHQRWKDWYKFENDGIGKVKLCDFWYKDIESRYMVEDTKTGDRRMVEHGLELEEIGDQLMIQVFRDMKAQIGDDFVMDADVKERIGAMAQDRFKIYETFKPVWYQCVYTFNTLLLHQRSPRPDGEHPYMPFFAQHSDGNFNSFLEDIEEIVISLNKALAFRELMMAHSAKGMLVVDEATLKDSGYTADDIANEYTRIGGLLVLNPKYNKKIQDVIQQFSTVGDGLPAINQLIADYDQRLYRISGVSLAQLGVTQSETPTSRYKMQLAEGAETNGMLYDNFKRSLEGFYGNKMIPLVVDYIENNPQEVGRLIGDQYGKWIGTDLDDDFGLFVDGVKSGEYSFMLIPEDDNVQLRTEREGRYWELASNGMMPIEVAFEYSSDPNRYDIVRKIKKWKHKQRLDQLQNSVDMKQIQQILLQDSSVDAEMADRLIKKMRLQKQQEKEQSQQQQQLPQGMENIKKDATQSKKEAQIDRRVSQ